MAHTIAILGAGVGGLLTAQHLRRQLPDEDRILLIDRSFTASLGLSLLWVVRGWRDRDRTAVTVAPPSLPGVELVPATVAAIDPDRRTVHTGTGQITYDALVIALGSELDIDATPGLATGLDQGLVHQFYTPAGAEALHRRLREVPGGRVIFAIAGVPFKCPAAPFEAALLAMDLFRETPPISPVQVDTFTPDPLPMPVAGAAVGEELVALLKQHEIGFYPNRVVTSVQATERELCFADGGRESYDVLAVVPRHKPPQPVAELRLSPAGWVPVDPRILATELDGVWALGDVTAMTLPNGKPLPKAAVFAEGQSKVVANGVARYLGYSAPEPWFDGRGACYIEIGNRMAAKGEGFFLDQPAPTVCLYPPSLEYHMEKQEQEAEWLRRWAGVAADPIAG